MNLLALHVHMYTHTHTHTHSWCHSRVFAGWFGAGSYPGVLCVPDNPVHQDAEAAKEAMEDNTGRIICVTLLSTLKHNYSSKPFN